MLSDCDYNKIRLLHDLSRLLWFVKKHAHADAKKQAHDECSKIYKKLEVELEKHIDELKKIVEKSFCKK